MITHFQDYLTMLRVERNMSPKTIQAYQRDINQYLVFLANKDVLVPTNTFIATYNAIKFSGANPILVDTGKDDLNVNLEEIKKKVTKNTQCICLVHVGSYITNDINMLNNINEINNDKSTDIRKFIINNNNIKKKILPRKK